MNYFITYVYGRNDGWGYGSANPCYHCTDGLHDRCLYSMCKYKYELRNYCDVDALTIGINEVSENDD